VEVVANVTMKLCGVGVYPLDDVERPSLFGSALELEAVEDARVPPRDPPPRIDDRCLLIADHPRFLELDVDRRQVSAT
jgi:hypothetical protein